MQVASFQSAHAQSRQPGCKIGAVTPNLPRLDRAQWAFTAGGDHPEAYHVFTEHVLNGFFSPFPIPSPDAGLRSPSLSTAAAACWAYGQSGRPLKE